MSVALPEQKRKQSLPRRAFLRQKLVQRDVASSAVPFRHPFMANEQAPDAFIENEPPAILVARRRAPGAPTKLPHQYPRHRSRPVLAPHAMPAMRARPA